MIGTFVHKIRPQLNSLPSLHARLFCLHFAFNYNRNLSLDPGCVCSISSISFSRNELKCTKNSSRNSMTLSWQVLHSQYYNLYSHISFFARRAHCSVPSVGCLPASNLQKKIIILCNHWTSGEEGEMCMHERVKSYSEEWLTWCKIHFYYSSYAQTTECDVKNVRQQKNMYKNISETTPIRSCCTQGDSKCISHEWQAGQFVVDADASAKFWPEEIDWWKAKVKK